MSDSFTGRSVTNASRAECVPSPETPPELSAFLTVSLAADVTAVVCTYNLARQINIFW